MLAFIRRGDAEPLMINVPETIKRHLVRRGPHGVDRRLLMPRSARRDRNTQYDLFLAGESINSLPTLTVERQNYRQSSSGSPFDQPAAPLYPMGKANPPAA